MKYRKKPVVIKAFELGVDHPPGWFDMAVESETVTFERNHDGSVMDAIIATPEGSRRAVGARPGRGGDFIIQGVEGELYPCKPSIFHATYERVEDEDE